MRIQETLNLFPGTKKIHSNDHYTVLCPCHDDHKPSLDIKKGETGIVMFCPVCEADGEKVMQTLGLDVKELFYDSKRNNSTDYPFANKKNQHDSNRKKKPLDFDYNAKKAEAVYRYTPDLVKFRFPEKNMLWVHRKDGEWFWGRKGIKPPLYRQALIKTALEKGAFLYIVEGEKDCNTVYQKLKCLAVSVPDGAGNNKWNPEHNKLFAGVNAVIIPDNDIPGRDFANLIAAQIKPYAASVRILDLRREWDWLKEKGDITDVYEGEKPLPDMSIADTVRTKLEALVLTTEEYEISETSAPPLMNLSDNESSSKGGYGRGGSPPLPDFTYSDIISHKADDIGTAEFFSELVKDFMCYVPEEKAFYIYNGIVWKQDIVKENLAAGKLLMDYVSTAQQLIPPPPTGNPREWSDQEAEQEKIARAFRSQYKTLGNSNGRERIMKDIKKLLYRSRNSFDTQPHLLNCLNCTYNLETGESLPHSAEDFITNCVNAKYEPEAKNERFDRFIDEICEGSEEQKTALQTALGYSLIGATPEECFFIAYGKSTRNGKGTLFDLVLDVLGDYGTQMDFDTIARSGTKDASRATPDLARLVGIRYVLVNEPQKGICFNEGLVKQLTGSDNITARPLYGSVIEFKPLFTIFITTNTLPSVSDDTLFTSDRIRIIPFNRHFTKEERDTSLKSTLRKDGGKEAVLKWLIDGYAMYRRNGLNSTESGTDILRRYRAENDYVQQFIDECLDVHNQNDYHSKKTKLTAIQRAYNDWCKESNIKPLGKKHFKEELEKHGISIIVSCKQYAAKVKIRDFYSSEIY